MDTFKSLKRHHRARTEVRWEVSFITPQGKIAGETVNISSEGVMVSCQELPPLEDDFRMLIKPPNHYPIDITGRVVWTTICNPVSGAETIGVDVQFMSIPENDRLFLQSMIPEQFRGKMSEIGNQPMVQPEVDAETEPGLTNTPHVAEISLPVFYNRGGKTVKATGSRFSTKGCHLYTKLAPPSGSVFSLKVENPQTGKSIRVDSSVVQRKRCAIKKQWGMILRFMNLSGPDREEIKQILLDASSTANPKKEPRYIKSKIGQALLKHFTKKRTIH
jgi:hypothetical protein